MPLTQWQSRQKPLIDAELSRIVDRLARFGVQRVILFGSHARGGFHEGSDIDLIVIHETKERFIDRTATFLEIMDPQLPVDVLVYTPAEYDAMKQRRTMIVAAAEAEGKVLYERGAARQSG
jgi:predicted nucleotidyltransferase